MRLFLRKFFRIFFILWGLIGIGASVAILFCMGYILLLFHGWGEGKDREVFGGDFKNVAFMFESGGIDKSNFDSVEYRYDSVRAFNGDGISVYTVKTKNLDAEKLDKNLWFALKDRPPIIAEAVDFLKSVKNAPDINFDRENIYIAPLFIRKYEYVTDATLLVYDASDGRIYYLDCNT